MIQFIKGRWKKSLVIKVKLDSLLLSYSHSNVISFFSTDVNWDCRAEDRVNYFQALLFSSPTFLVHVFSQWAEPLPLGKNERTGVLKFAGGERIRKGKEKTPQRREWDKIRATARPIWAYERGHPWFCSPVVRLCTVPQESRESARQLATVTQSIDCWPWPLLKSLCASKQPKPGFYPFWIRLDNNSPYWTCFLWQCSSRWRLIISHWCRSRRLICCSSRRNRNHFHS